MGSKLTWLIFCAVLTACNAQDVDFFGFQDSSTETSQDANSVDGADTSVTDVVTSDSMNLNDSSNVDVTGSQCQGSPIDGSNCSGYCENVLHQVATLRTTCQQIDSSTWGWKCECVPAVDAGNDVMVLPDTGNLSDASNGVDVIVPVDNGMLVDSGNVIDVAVSILCENDSLRGAIGTQCGNNLQGACARVGVYECLNNIVRCNAPFVMGMNETCNGIDDNCDGVVDNIVNGSCTVDAGVVDTGTDSAVDTGVVTDAGCANPITCWPDRDGDGYGDAFSLSQTLCNPLVGFSGNNLDCNDNNINIRPGVTETCNSVDDNCNGSVDEGVGTNWYVDSDQDGFGRFNAIPVRACTAPSGYVANSTDCNDSNATIRPTATETCNGADDNCSGFIDEGVCTQMCTTRFYRDQDGDGFPTAEYVTSCTAPSGYIAQRSDGQLDCADQQSTAYPGAVELCTDTIDNNCNGTVNENCSTSTGDRWRYSFQSFRQDLGVISNPAFRRGDWTVPTYLASSTSSQPFSFMVDTRFDNSTLSFQSSTFGNNASIVGQIRNWGTSTSISDCEAPNAQVRLERLASDGRVLETIYQFGGLQPPVIIVDGRCRLGR